VFPLRVVCTTSSKWSDWGSLGIAPVFMLTIDVLKMLERFINFVNEHEGVEWVTMAEMAQDFRDRNEPPKGARMPKLVGEEV